MIIEAKILAYWVRMCNGSLDIMPKADLFFFQIFSMRKKKTTTKNKTSKFDGTLDHIRIEKVISSMIWAC